MWKHFVADYLSFSKRERTGIIVLMSFIGFFIGIPFLYPFFIKSNPTDAKIFKKQIASLSIKQRDSAKQFERSEVDRKYKESDYKLSNDQDEKVELFNFDPNTASTEELKKLGFREKTIKTIQNFLSKGGKFYKSEDIGKVWGLRPDEVKRLIPFIQIKSLQVSHLSEGNEFKKNPLIAITHLMISIDINTADTTEFISLQGIGSKLSQRIINFRDKLGGFYSVEQVGETFGLPDSTFQKIKSQLKISSPALTKININTADLESMKMHPYLRYAIGNAIVRYRAQHGNFSAVADIKKIATITEDIFNKAAPYLTVEKQ
jgi:competence ComEA-like helix-hairpin-helix protein